MTQLNLAGPHTFWLEAVWTADMWSLGKEILLFDWFILGESWGIWSCVPDIYESCYLFGCVWCSDHPSNMNAHLHMLSCVPLCVCVWEKKRVMMIFQDGPKIQMVWNISISPALCAWARKCGGNCFPELFAGIKGNLTLLMANADAELSSFLCYQHQSLESHCEDSFA